jgi:hypothetical protein
MGHQPWSRSGVASIPGVTGPSWRIKDIGAYLGVSHQRPEQMFHEGKFPKSERVDGIGPKWRPATIQGWAEREWWGTRLWRKQS